MVLSKLAQCETSIVLHIVIYRFNGLLDNRVVNSQKNWCKGILRQRKFIIVNVTVLVRICRWWKYKIQENVAKTIHSVLNNQKVKIKIISLK